MNERERAIRAFSDAMVTELLLSAPMGDVNAEVVIRAEQTLALARAAEVLGGLGHRVLARAVRRIGRRLRTAPW